MTFYGPKRYFMYENIISNNNVIMTRAYCTHFPKLFIYIFFYFYTNKIPLSECKRIYHLRQQGRHAAHPHLQAL